MRIQYQGCPCESVDSYIEESAGAEGWIYGARSWWERGEGHVQGEVYGDSAQGAENALLMEQSLEMGHEGVEACPECWMKTQLVFSSYEI